MDEAEEELSENVQDINLNNAIVIPGGEVHLTEVTQVTQNINVTEVVYIGNLGNVVGANDVIASGSRIASLEQRVENKDAELRANQITVANIKVKSQETILVELLVVNRKNVEVEGFHEILFLSGNENNVTWLKVEEFCMAAKENAIKEAESKFSDQATKTNYIAKYGNFIVITGGAGYGKTTLGIQILQYVCDTEPECGYIFYVNLPSLDNSKEMSVFEFLIKLFNSNWQYHLETDNKILERISKSNNVWIIMDSMDETGFNLSMKAPVIGLYDRAKPEVILQNLLRSDILRNAFKYLITRPEAYLQLDPDCKSHFPLEVLGLGKNSQDLLFKEICKSQEKYEKVKEVLNQNPAANVLNFIPLFAKAIPKYILKYGLDGGAFSTTDVFTSFLNDYIRSAHFKNHPSVLHKLSELALFGMLQEKVVFEAHDLAKVGLETNGLEDFLKFQVQSNDIGLKILEGDKSILFNHKLLQEFFSALKIMLDTPIERFTKLLENLKSVKWEMVLQFIFGLLNPKLQSKLNALFPISSADVSTKRGLLKDLLISMAKDFAQTSENDFPVSLALLFELNFETHAKWQEFQGRSDDKRLFKLCSLAYESMLDDITRSVVEVFPDMVLLSLTILPSHVASLCHVLRATDKPITINVGAFGELAKFIGDGLKMLIETVAETPHTIRKFYVDETAISIATLAPLIPHMEELTIWHGNLSVDDIKLICESLQRKTQPLKFLNLSYNNLDEAGVKLLSGCIPYIERLSIKQCGLTSDHLLVLVSSIEQRQHPIEFLNLSFNNLDEGLNLLPECIPYIERLSIMQCGLTSDQLMVLASSIKQRQHPMDWLNLSGNKIGSRGACCLAASAHKLNKLSMEDCGIDEEELTEAIARREHPMEVLNIRNNPLGDRGASALARCRGKIDRLFSDDCDFTSAGKQELESAQRRHQESQPIKRGSNQCHVM